MTEQQPGPALVTHSVDLSYRQGRQPVYALRDIEIRLTAPAFIGIQGPSGSGKSSLLYLLAGLKRPTKGWIEALGQNLGALNAEGRNRLRRRAYGLIFQQPFLIHYLTAAENVAVGAPVPDRQAVRRAEDILNRFGMASLARRRPHEMSGGQRQRVAAARALMNDPAVVLADEPTASLDHQAGREVMALLDGYRHQRGALLVVVTHDSSITAGADRIIQLWDGALRSDESSS